MSGIESRIKGKKKREMVKLLSSIENSLIQFDRLAEVLEAIVLGGEDGEIAREMFDKMSPEEKRKLQAMFERIEFRIRGVKNRIMMPAHCRHRPPLR